MDMDAEFLQLAREAVTALRAANQPNWAEIASVVVAGVGVIVQGCLIGWGLWRMGKASEERNRQLDQQADILGKIGQALDRQGAALDRQGAALERQSAALERQGDVLAELLRRTA